MMDQPTMIADGICQAVAELPDRDSPADWPEAMLVTSEELHRIVTEALAFAPLAIALSLAGDTTTPMQPIVWSGDGVIRFKENRIVNAILERSSRAGYDLNAIARDEYTPEDRMQLAQLTGYSISGYGTLSYASPESAEKADAIADAMSAARAQQEGGTA